ncbi:MAG: citrate synthase [Janthinobacterium lividum]
MLSPKGAACGPVWQTADASRPRAWKNVASGFSASINLLALPSILIRFINIQPVRTMGWITATQALSILNVLPQTLYANVSRGKIRAQPDRMDVRRSLYHQEDVLRMAKRQNGRRKVETIAAQAIEWGDPVLPSALSTVCDGRLWYRGRDAVVLSATASPEEIAGLLWECATTPFPCGTVADPAACGDPGANGHENALQAALVSLARRSARDLPSMGRPRAALREEAAQVLGTLVMAMLGDGAACGDATLSARMSSTWNRPDAEDAIRCALVLLADHELNASTFAVRVAISTGASLAAGVLAGLASLTGPLHGGAAIALGALLESAGRLGVDAAVRERLARERTLPGFGHPLYPDGDVRAIALLHMLPPHGLHARLAEHVADAIGERPNIDFALVLLAEKYDLPTGAPFILFALGRCIGWLAHALEQAAAQRLIRPRARYVGIAPMMKR